jgi:hypothetical protein
MHFFPTWHELCQALMSPKIIVRSTQRGGIYKNARSNNTKLPVLRFFYNIEAITQFAHFYIFL